MGNKPTHGNAQGLAQERRECYREMKRTSLHNDRVNTALALHPKPVHSPFNDTKNLTIPNYDYKAEKRASRAAEAETMTRGQLIGSFSPTPAAYIATYASEHSEMSMMTKHTPGKETIKHALKREELQPLTNSVIVLYRFWRDVFDGQHEQQKGYMGYAIANHFYQNNIPLRHLCDEVTIEVFGNQFLDMTKWLLLTASHRGGDMLLSRIRKLEEKHSNRAVPFSHWYMAMTHSLHKCFLETFGERVYSTQVQLALDKFFHVIQDCNEETTDHHSQFERRPSVTASESSADTPKSVSTPKSSLQCSVRPYLDNINACLRSRRGVALLEQYCTAKKFPEYINFHKAYLEYKKADTVEKRSILGDAIVTRFIGSSAAEEILFSYTIKRELSQHKVYTTNMFDNAHAEVFITIERNIWPHFVKAMDIFLK